MHHKREDWTPPLARVKGVGRQQQEERSHTHVQCKIHRSHIILFFDFCVEKFYSSIRLGRTGQDAKVVDTSQLKCAADWVSYKSEHTDT